MTLRSSFFNSVGGDRIYDASNFASYFASFIGNGVFPNPSNNLQVVAVSGNVLRVSVSVGKGFINGYYAENDAPLELQLTPADGTLNRIDRVVLGLNTTNRLINAYVKTGTTSSSPIAPTLTRGGGVYELSLAEVRINSNTTSISQANITDTRPNNDVCGFVTSTVNQVDTSTLFLQYQQAFNDYSTEQEQNFADFLARIESQLDGNTAGNLQNQINNKANIDSPNLTGSPTAPTKTVGTNDTSIANALFVNNSIKTVKNTIQPVISATPLWIRIGRLNIGIGAFGSKLSTLVTGAGRGDVNSYDSVLINASLRGGLRFNVQSLAVNPYLGNPTRYGYIPNINGNAEFWMMIPNSSYQIDYVNLGATSGALDFNPIVTTEPTGIIYVDVVKNTTTATTGDLATLQTQDKTSIVGSINELFTSVSNGKNAIASAITSKGVPSQGSDTFAQLATNINNITTGSRVASGTSTASTTTLPFTRTLPSSGSVDRLFINVSGLSFFPTRIVVDAPQETFSASFEGIVRDPSRRIILAGNSATNQYEVISQQGNVTISGTGFRLPLPFLTTPGQSIRWMAYEQ